MNASQRRYSGSKKKKKNFKNRSYKVYLELQNLLIELAILNDNSEQQRYLSFGIHDTPTF